MTMRMLLPDGAATVTGWASTSVASGCVPNANTLRVR